MSKHPNHTLDSWEPNYRLGDGCAIKHGFAFKGESMTTDASVNTPIVVNIVNFQYTGGFRFGETKIQRYLGAYPPEYRLQPGDVLLVMTCQTPQGEILGVPGRIPLDGRIYLHNQRMGLVVLKDSSKLDLSFLYYLFISRDFNQHLFKTSTGAKILHTAPSRIEDFRFTRPPLQTQQQIASILSAYDDLIENNTRRIKILEQMAQMLYREWFVNFRFPGHETVKMVESEMGLIPEGWRIGSLSQALVLQRGFDLPTSQRHEGQIPIYASTGPSGTHNIAKVKAPGVVTGRSGSLGSVNLVLDDFWPLNTTLWVKEFKQSSAYHAYFLLQDMKLGGFNSGAAVPTLNRNDIHGLPTVLPSVQVLAEFDSHAAPLFQMRKVLHRKNDTLRNTRDLLLPKLISGEVSVENLEREALAATV